MNVDLSDDIVFARFINYINITLRHKRLNYIRNKKRREEREKKLAKKELELLFVNNSSSSFSISSNINSEKLSNAILKLSNKQQTLIKMIFFEGKSSKEISKILNMNNNAIRQLKYRAMKNLKKYMEK